MLKLRPHHILDIVRNIGNKRPVVPHEYGHLLHVITKEIIANRDTECMLVIENDDICGPCKMLTPNRKCTDILHQLDEPVSKQEYNDDLDRRILTFLNIKENEIITIRDYLSLIKKNLDEIVDICTHPKENKESRRSGLINGMKILKIE